MTDAVLIKKTLGRYALNEFVANAVDAKASTFSVLLDERTFESSKVVAPGIAELQRRPALLLYNNAKFNDTDFRGLRKVGQGGKRSNPDSIGRYGLGALSLFHFTDVCFYFVVFILPTNAAQVVQIVSNEHLLILDPSGTHLPPLKGRPRTALFRRLSKVSRCVLTSIIINCISFCVVDAIPTSSRDSIRSSDFRNRLHLILGYVVYSLQYGV